MLKELKHSPVQQADAKFELACPSCGKNRQFKSKGALQNALTKETNCYSCRTIANNQKRKGTKVKENNPAWKGYKDIPGKIFSKLKRGAKHRNLCFEITIEDIQEQFEKQNKSCAFSGISLIFGHTASVDRIDSREGYTKDNIQIVHKQLNMIKRDTPNDEFINWCILVARYSLEEK